MLQRALLVKARSHKDAVRHVRVSCVRSLSTATKSKTEVNDTGVRIYNSLRDRIEPLVVARGRPMSWYACGPTVYDVAHLGHASCYVRFDIVRRILQNYFRLPIVQVMGMTDVDDKILAKASALGVHPTEVARQYEALFAKDMAALGVLPPHWIARVSEHIDDIVAFVQRLELREFAYTAGDGGVYFDTRKLPNYGALARGREASQWDDESTEGKASVKRHPADFALWKPWKAGESLSWDSPWGKGRPGWHIECSAMASRMFGAHLDLHSGGIDLRFPHHNNEVAQCVAHHGCEQWGNYFMHSGHVHIEGRKMSKSLKNFVSIADFLGSGDAAATRARHFRILCLLSSYRSNIEIGDPSSALVHAETVDKKISALFEIVGAVSGVGSGGSSEWGASLPSMRWGKEEEELLKALSDTEMAVDGALRSDFSTPEVVTATLALVSRAHAYIMGAWTASSGGNVANTAGAVHLPLVANVARFINETFSVFGVPYSHGKTVAAGGDFDAAVDVLSVFRTSVRNAALATMRDARRGGKDGGAKEVGGKAPELASSILAACDGLRDESLKRIGVAFKDTPSGGTWTRGTPDGKS
eukprot:Opistho-1_new@86541